MNAIMMTIAVTNLMNRTAVRQLTPDFNFINHTPVMLVQLVELKSIGVLMGGAFSNLGCATEMKTAKMALMKKTAVNTIPPQRNCNLLICSTADTCADHQFRCADYECVNADLRCEGTKNCADNSDETGCGELSFGCTELDFV